MTLTASKALALLTGLWFTGCASDSTAESLLAKFLAMRAKVPCGTWQEPYVSLHSAVTAKQEKMFLHRRQAISSSEQEFLPNSDSHPKFVIYDCIQRHGWRHSTACGGLGDMIKGVVSAFTFALLTGRVFLISAPVLEYAFSSPHINWTMPAGLLGEKPRIAQKNFHSFSLEGSNLTVFSSSLLRGHPHYTYRWFCNLTRAPYSDFDVVVLRWNRGILEMIMEDVKPDGTVKGTWGGGWYSERSGSEISPHRACQLAHRKWWTERGITTGAQAHACILRFLLQPRVAMFQPLLGTIVDQLDRPGITTVGVHIRTGDNNLMSDEMVNVSSLVETSKGLFQCAALVEKQMRQQWIARGGIGSGQQQQLFVVSDSLRLKRALKEKDPAKVVIMNFQPVHSATPFETGHHMRKVIKDLVGEWLAFSLCQFHVFRLSGWSLTAALLTSDPFAARNFIFDGGNSTAEELAAPTLCNLSKPTNWNAVQEWGGL
eukprot:TRINITY_DN8056_c0_g1_i1.p1 TRINITY_DN8056_c0_g1~~TRINITY_DN8056_c0_g1_i1.p1  ORF type:complete len:486 (+),score=26.82 TRINITY_DN8056_c0_g1_i1:511-1968(+)